MPYTTYARSFRACELLGQLWPQVTPRSQLWLLLFMLLVGVSPASAGVLFAPQSRAELKRAVDNCRLKLLPKAACSIADWDVSRGSDMSRVFYGAKSFNEDISKWDVSRVRDMSAMFQGATSFNRDISKWQVSSVNNMDNMFRNAASFKQNLCGARWVHSKATKRDMFAGSPGSISSDVCSPVLGESKMQRRAFVSRTELKSAIASHLACENPLGHVSVSIQYCGGWGYGHWSQRLRKQLQEAFGAKISVREIRDPGTTGNFEVVVNGDLVWSKQTRKQGFPATEAQVETICDEIRDRQHVRRAPTTTIAAMDIFIQYCGGWGYGPKSHWLKEQLEAAFDGKISVREFKDPGKTGNFEVVVNGDLVWSKRTMGDGFPTDKEDVEDICYDIRKRRNGGS